MSKRIILASKSPRRKELLEQIGLSFEVIVSDADENIDKTHPGEMVEVLSNIKATAVLDTLDFDDESKKDILIIGSDTVVAFDDNILGKPKDSDDAFCMLKMLSGKAHSVYTGVTLIYYKNNEMVKDVFSSKTDVFMYEMSDEEIKEYIATGEPMDKAGSYAIQGISAKFIQKIEGDYNTVVGLPVSMIYQRIKGEL